MQATTYRTPRGAPITLFIRPDTNDGALVAAMLAADEYQTANLYLDGWALDVGAHVGSIGLSLAIDNPVLRVVMVEPVPSNAELIRASIAANNLTDRVFLEEAGAGAVGQATTPCSFGYTKADGLDPHYVHDTRFVGNVIRGDSNPEAETIDVPVVTLTGLASKYGDFRFLKIDCEGCEWQFLRSGAEHAEEIIGEWHDGPYADIEAILRATHTVEMIEDKGGIGTFRAKRVAA